MARRRAATVAGHRGDEAVVRAFFGDPDPEVRARALSGLGRMDRALTTDLLDALADSAPVVRRRAARVAGHPAVASSPDIDGALVERLGDPDPLVVDEVCW